MLTAPKQGNRLHDWLLYHTRDLLLKEHSMDEAYAILVEATQNSERTTQDIEREILDALDGARDFLEENPDFTHSKKRVKKGWVDPLSWVGLGDPMVRRDKRKAKLHVNYKKRELAIAQGGRVWRKVLGYGEEDFNYPDLFAGIDFDICAGKDVRENIIIPLSKWRGKLEKMSYVVPNYFRKCSEEGAQRCDFDIGERLYLVVEFDDSSMEDQLARLNYLNKLSLPFKLAMIVFSGGTSFHGWYTCYGNSEYRVVTFCRKATEIGADKTTYSPSQYIRMPNGWNYTHKRKQDVIYFDIELVNEQNKIVRRECL